MKLNSLLLTAWIVTCFGTLHAQPVRPIRGATVGELKSRKNVLFIAVDDLRTKLGCYGDTIAITPNIDKLARRGVLFGNAYCQQAVCAPSRASLLTGRRPDTTKVWDLKTHFRAALPDVITLPQYFKQHGYHSQSVGKIYHDPYEAQDPVSWSVPETLAVTDEIGGRYALPENLNVPGIWPANKANSTERADVADNAYIDGQVSDEAIRILHQIKNRPFFLAVGFRRPHLPFVAPEKYWAMYDRKEIPGPANPRPPSDVPAIALQNWGELRSYTDIPDTGFLTEPTKVRELIQGYYASTSFVDAQIGKVVDELDRLQLMEDTIIVLWSDHGFHLGEQGMWAKRTNFEVATRVPLVVFSPDHGAKGATSSALVELVDVFPTLTELAGLPLPAGLEGVSLVPLLDDPHRKWKTAAFSQFLRTEKNNKVMGYSVRTQHFRYTEWQHVPSGTLEAAELYDLARDPLESVNVIDSGPYRAAIAELASILRGGWEGARPLEGFRR